MEGSVEVVKVESNADGPVDGDGEVVEKPVGFEYFTDSSDA